jgi:hypothetical protein
VLLVLPAPKEGHETTIAVLTAEALIAGSKATASGTNAVVAEAGTASVYVWVPPLVPVTVTLTTEAAVAPAPVTLKPQMYVVLPATAGSVAVAVAAATLPELAEMIGVLLRKSIVILC